MSAYLIGIGAVVGGVLGAIAFGAGMLGDGASPLVLVNPWTLILGGSVGALIGAVLAPVMAWIFLRRVPLWRAIAEPAIGTLLGIVIALLVAPWATIALPVIGFVVGGVRLWVVDGRRERVQGPAV